MRGVVIAGTHSGVGKTTIATGIMAALVQRGVRVQPFKVGPDYIDPSYHTSACGVPSHNLDTWLLEPPVVRELFARALRGKDIAVVEGVMGLYDGFGGDGEEGSTAHLAKLLQLPVLLVVDASGAVSSVGATVMGFKAFDPQLNIAGVLLNGIAGERHLELIQPSLAKTGVPLLGYLPQGQELTLPQRHLGLIPTREGTVARDFYRRLAEQVVRTIDLDRLLSVAAPVSVSADPLSGTFPEAPRPAQTAIAVAMDRAFSFYYADSLNLLEAWGAELIPFSPLKAQALPPRTGGVYIGGGFPELYAPSLADNAPMLQSLRQVAQRGIPIYAECGGLMFLGQSIEDQDGTSYPMAGILPARSTMKGTRLTLGYRTVSALRDSLLMKAGEKIRGHEFHLSTLKEEPSQAMAVYRVEDQSGRHEGFRVKNVIASYIHLHMASKRGLAHRFVEFCAHRGPGED